MCKFCKLKLENEYIGEYTTNETIGKIEDGSQIFEVSLNRYIVEDDNTHSAELVLNYGVRVNKRCDDVYAVSDTEIKIKYCPFCGEKL